MIHPAIIQRYKTFLSAFKAECNSNPGTDGGHLVWMLEGIESGAVTGNKAHRWLGFIQGCLIKSGITTVEIERNFTRDFFTKSEEL